MTTPDLKMPESVSLQIFNDAQIDDDMWQFEPAEANIIRADLAKQEWRNLAEGKSVRIPTSIEEARLMAILGTNYLLEHAPYLLKMHFNEIPTPPKEKE